MVLRSDPRPPRTPRVGAWLVDVAAANAGRAVYGAVMVGVLLAAENARHEGYPATIEAAVIVLVLYWLTSFYTHALGERLQRRESLNATLLWRSCIHELPVMEGALIPVLVLLVAWATGFTVDSGARVAFLDRGGKHRRSGSRRGLAVTTGRTRSLDSGRRRRGHGADARRIEARSPLTRARFGMTLVDLGTMGGWDARTQGAPIAEAIGATEDAAACPPSVSRRHRLHFETSS